ncbi:serine/threonine-protein kinase [Streptomyces sp. NBC_00838]|uniref:serine/threonine-protein kinase n=1 Tax=Streptomyces sp. NBC_00838 TaxID=2903680 RepID=UPI00386AFC5B|nr:serine/threonine-protein kinase [Streptomyces sp. NBC_00838]
MEAGWEEVRAGELINDRYELVDRAGQGAMAQIWRANDRETGRQVAVKFLRLDTEDLRRLDPREQEEELEHLRLRFIREARFLALLRHPNIPEHYAFGTHGGVPYLVMYHVAGINLRKFLKDYTPLAPAVAVSAAAQFAAAFVHAHERGVVHRDLKPDNLMISERGVGFLIDFGIGKQLGIESTLTQPGSSLGTPGYQAPEQIQGEEATAATDVYSFCCVFYELLTGRAPFITNDRDGSVERQHLRTTALRPSDLAAGIDDALDELVLRGLAKEPEQRPTMREILDVVSELTPRHGDPEPLPWIPYDATRPFRVLNENTAADPSPEQVSAGGTGDDEDGGWLDPDAIELLCSAAERELEKGEPAGAVSELAGLVSRVREEWGRRPLVRQVWELTAGGLWLAGDFDAAARLYENIADDLVPGDNSGERADRAVFGLRAARCRLESDGDTGAAINVVTEAGYTAAALPEPYATQVETECREAAAHVSELLGTGHTDTNSGAAPERE